MNRKHVRNNQATLVEEAFLQADLHEDDGEQGEGSASLQTWPQDLPRGHLGLAVPARLHPHRHWYRLLEVVAGIRATEEDQHCRSAEVSCLRE